MITPAAPGGTTDLLARLFGAKLSEVFRQNVIVDNRGSASGLIAAEITAHARPDGYTLFVPYHQHTVNAAMNPKLPYHAVNDFTPITQLTSAGLMLVVNPSTPVKNLKEFVDWTRSFKGALNFGSAGLPKPIVARLHMAIVRILNQPEIRERILADGSEPVGNSPEEFRQYMLADVAKWAKLIKESGAKLD